MLGKLDILEKLDLSENCEEVSLKCEKFDMSEKPDLPDSVEPIESVDIWDIRLCPLPIKFFRSSKPVEKLGGGWKKGSSVPLEKDCLKEEVEVELFLTDMTEPSGICWTQDSLTSAASADSARLNLPLGSSSLRLIFDDASLRAA